MDGIKSRLQRPKLLSLGVQNTIISLKYLHSMHAILPSWQVSCFGANQTQVHPHYLDILLILCFLEQTMRLSTFETLQATALIRLSRVSTESVNTPAAPLNLGSGFFISALALSILSLCGHIQAILQVNIDALAFISLSRALIYAFWWRKFYLW